MYDLRFVTFNIPVRYDTPHRKENVELILDYLTTHFLTRIVLAEEDRCPHFEYLREYCDYVFIQSEHEYYHRTHSLNVMAEMSTTPVIVNYDCDVMLSVQAYLAAAVAIRDDKMDLCLPYDGRFFDVPRNYYETIRNTKSLESVNLSECVILNTQSVGGVVFWNRQRFLDVGMENEHFISWGFEDNERIVRAAKLGLRAGRVEGVVYHMFHDRLINSFRHPHVQANIREWDRVRTMTREDLERYISSWPWVHATRQRAPDPSSMRTCSCH